MRPDKSGARPVGAGLAPMSVSYTCGEGACSCWGAQQHFQALRDWVDDMVGRIRINRQVENDQKLTLQVSGQMASYPLLC